MDEIISVNKQLFKLISACCWLYLLHKVYYYWYYNHLHSVFLYAKNRSAVFLDVIAITALIIYVTRVMLGYKQTTDRYQVSSLPILDNAVVNIILIYFFVFIFQSNIICAIVFSFVLCSHMDCVCVCVCV